MILEDPHNFAIGYASQKRHNDFCQELIIKGIFEGMTNTQLVHAIYLHEYDKVIALIKKGKTKAFLNNKSNELMMAAEIGNIDILAALLEENSGDINVQNNHGLTALMIAAMMGNKETVELLLDRGAVIDEIDI